MRSFALNLVLATTWLLLNREPSPAVFGIGFLMGFAFLAAFQTVLGSQDYTRRCVAFARFAALFLREFVVANAKVAWIVLFRNPDSLRPNFIVYDVTGLTRIEILLLSYCISLTPGTTTVDVGSDFRTLVLHALDADRPDAIRAEIDRTLKRGILEFTR